MTDLEMTKLCARAMGYRVLRVGSEPAYVVDDGKRQHAFDPLNDDAKAMALVKRFGLTVVYDLVGERPEWMVGKHEGMATGFDLNRAIVECVAKMQAAKVPA